MNDWIDRFRSLRDGNSSRSLLYQLLLVGGGLLLLWGLIALIPSSPPPSPPVASDEAGTVATSMSESDGFTVFTPGRIAVLVLLAGGAAGAYYLNKRSNQQTSSTAAATLQSLGQMPLSQNQQLQLIRCSDEILLLGVSPNEIRLLKSYPEAEFEPPDGTPLEADATATPAEPSSATLSSFAHVLRQYANGSNHE